MTTRLNPRPAAIIAGLLFLLLLAGAVMVRLNREPPPPKAVANDQPIPGEAMVAGAFDPPHQAPEFALPGSDGSQVTLASYRGKVVLLTFGFTYCAAVCPTTLATLAQARRSLGKAADHVQVIFVTVDPARDNAANMRDYLAAFDRSFVGAAGEPGDLAAVRRGYGVTAARHGTGPDYAIAHTSSVFLIDRAGKLRAMMPYGHSASDFVHDLRILLAS